MADQRPLWILKHVWRDNGRLKVSEAHELMQESDNPFKSAKALAKFIVGGDVTLDNGKIVTIGNRRAQFSSNVTGMGPQSIDSFWRGEGCKNPSSHMKFIRYLAHWGSLSFSTCRSGQLPITLCEAYGLVTCGKW